MGDSAPSAYFTPVEKPKAKGYNDGYGAQKPDQYKKEDYMMPLSFTVETTYGRTPSVSVTRVFDVFAWKRRDAAEMTWMENASALCISSSPLLADGQADSLGSANRTCSLTVCSISALISFP
uniref:Metalloproteinase inhibitor 2 n=1 Tax=Steinernema glaseri TaxID=37863 RepID=A0A1I7Y8R1_9BILA